MKTRRSSTLGQKAAAEAIGTFALVFIGCGAIAIDGQSGGALGHLGVCICFGFVVMAMIYATGHISGAHFNPAVTLAFAVTGRFRLSWVIPYLAAQVGAALAAALLLRAIVGPSLVGLSATEPSIGLGGAIALEVTITFFLMFVISAVATDHRAVGSAAGLAIGATVLVCALIGGPLTGGSMNPARSIGPALASGAKLASLWIYLVGPLVGAALGGFAYHWVAGGSQAKQAHGH